MKIYGFDDRSDQAKLLDQVTLEVDSEVLRQLSKFFLICADEMDDDKDWSHEHFCDFLGEDIPADLVVYRSGQ